MANALKTLFQDIATAIRNQTGEGDDVKMKPADFPDKIAPAEENVPVTLNLSGGNQTVPAPDGTLMRSVVINKPDTLIPENIAQGVNIAGIIGALAGGGSGGDSGKTVTYKKGQFTPESTTETVTHGMGCIPDMIIVFCGTKSTATSTKIMWSICFNNAVQSACGGDSLGNTALMANGQFTLTIGQGTSGFESTAKPWAGVYAVTEDSFTVGGTVATLDTDCIYAYIAVAGLM